MPGARASLEHKGAAIQWQGCQGWIGRVAAEVCNGMHMVCHQVHLFATYLCLIAKTQNSSAQGGKRGPAGVWL